jgi:DUF2971 family protein
MTEIPERLYHYTTSKLALEKILPPLQLKMGSLGKTNDPRETKEWGFAIENPPMDLANPNEFVRQMDNIQKEMNRIRLEEWWALCLTQDGPYLAPTKVDTPDFSYELWGYARPNMWTHYAEDHKGVCLVLDGPTLHKAIIEAVPAKVFYAPVNYGRELDINHDQRAYQIEYPSTSSELLDALRNHTIKHHGQFFLRKARDWRTESEFRWLVHAGCGPFFIDISLSIKKVIAGMHFNESDLTSLKVLCDDQGIEIGKMMWRNRIPTCGHL